MDLEYFVVHIQQPSAEIIIIVYIPTEKEQQLYVRLFLRKHQWLRADKISYSDIAADLSPVLKALVHHGFLMDGKTN